jgi:hypothetical protein
MQTNKLGTAYDRVGLADTGLEVDVLEGHAERRAERPPA